MKPTCRVEIIIGKKKVERVTSVLEAHQLTGWSVLRVEAGAGDRGERRSDELSGATTGSLIITTCEPAALQALVEDLRPLLKRYGGACIVSDARWVVH
jgi:nitrogen regulatory protein PII